jgi:hypothetical protein
LRRNNPALGRTAALQGQARLGSHLQGPEALAFNTFLQTLQGLMDKE